MVILDIEHYLPVCVCEGGEGGGEGGGGRGEGGGEREEGAGRREEGEGGGKGGRRREGIYMHTHSIHRRNNRLYMVFRGNMCTVDY